jgi:hypothetical protein
MSQSPGDLEFNISRRSFWRALLQEAFVASRALKGEGNYTLSELGNWSDERLARIKPVVHPLCEIYVDNGHVHGCHKDTGETVELFPVDRVEDRVTLGLFDGEHTLRQVGSRLAEALVWDEARAYGHAQDLFLWLAERMICIPRDPRGPSD